MKRYREGRYTQEQLAAALGVTTSSVTQWEIGRIAPRRQRVEQMDELLGAGGALLDAFGYARPVSQLDDAAELRALVIALSEAQQEMSERLAKLGDEVAQLRGRTRRGAAASG